MILAGVLVLQAASASAAPAPPDTTGAAAAYAQGRAADAARAYQDIAERDGVSASLYYDLGAAQLGAGELSSAILSFERARWLAPGDAGIASALRGARERAGLAMTAESGWRRARNVASPDAWALVALAAVWLGCAAAALLLREPAGVLVSRPLRRALHGATATAGAALVVSVFACASFSSETSRAVALGQNLGLHIAPFEAAESRGTLAAGEIVRIEERHGDFVRVRAEDGRSGWVPQQQIGAVVPG
jgi:tetratricopeptide (TPR) repeat protein